MSSSHGIGIVLQTIITSCAAAQSGPSAPVVGQTTRDLQLVWTSAEANGTYVIRWADVDSDGDPDLAVGNKWGPGTNQLYRNDGGKLVLAWTAEVEDTTESDGLAWGDWDGDGDPDLAVGNDSGQPDRVYENDAGRLRLAWTSDEKHNTMGAAWAVLECSLPMSFWMINTGRVPACS